VNPIEYLALKYLHKNKHHNQLFYSLSPDLQVATALAFREAVPRLIADGAYYEFGIFKGYNLLFAHKLEPFINCYGFDSFQGMPVVKGVHPHHSKGMYGASVDEVRHHLVMHGADMRRVQLFDGFFGREWFKSLQEYPFEPAAIAVIDCDLYLSAVPVLEFLVPLLRAGSVILFDEWKMDSPSEKDAWIQCSLQYGLSHENLFDFGHYGRAIRVVGGVST